jgi:hypothetical protein
VVLIIKSKKNEFEKIEAAVPGWLGENGCVKIEVKSPSPDASFVKWIGPGATTAAINCEYVSGGLEYARFRSIAALDVALRLRPRKEKFCVIGRTLLEDELGGGSESGHFNEMCRNLHGTRY